MWDHQGHAGRPAASGTRLSRRGTRTRGYGPAMSMALWIALLSIKVEGRLPGPVCKSRNGDGGYCSCEAWRGGHEAYVGFGDEAAELKKALAAAHFRKE